MFFLDEPTALAAGHRPCFECRRAAAKAFLAAFPGGPSGADAMDEVLHRERLDGRWKRLWRAPLATLPEGAFVAIGGRAHALAAARSGHGVSAATARAAAFERGLEADVLTPRSTVAALAAGYRPVWPASSRA